MFSVTANKTEKFDSQVETFKTFHYIRIVSKMSFISYKSTSKCNLLF